MYAHHMIQKLIVKLERLTSHEVRSRDSAQDYALLVLYTSDSNSAQPFLMQQP